MCIAKALRGFAAAVFAVLCFTLAPGVIYAQTAQAPELSANDLQDAYKLMFSDEIGLDRRIDLAERVMMYLESSERIAVARQWCVEFAADVLADIDDAASLGAPPSNELNRLIELIHKGDVSAAAEGLRRLASRSSAPAPAAMVAALKVDETRIAYQTLFETLRQGVRSPAIDYLMAIFAARDKRLVESAQLFARVDGELPTDRLNQWASMDRAKMAIIREDVELAARLMEPLLAEHPDDPGVLYLDVLLVFARGQKDEARRRLSALLPRLQPDPYLLAQTATLAVRLNEIETAARLLEDHQNKIKANREFYEAFALVRTAQGRRDDAEAMLQKATDYKKSRITPDERARAQARLAETLKSLQRNQAPPPRMEGVAPLAQVYLHLLQGDSGAAVALLNQRIEAGEAASMEYWVQQTLQRRLGRVDDALQTLRSLRTADPGFRPYSSLALIADYALRSGDAKAAGEAYRELSERYPQSYQARVAERVTTLSNPKADTRFAAMAVSPMLMRFPQYAPAFALSEAMNAWDASASFTSVSAAMGVSAQRSLGLHEFIAAVRRGARLELTPFAPTLAAIDSFLQAGMPVVYCWGDSFGGQRIETLVMIIGLDRTRAIAYAEGVNADAPAILTEDELSRGLALALHPASEPGPEDEAATRAVQLGADYLRMNLDAIQSGGGDAAVPAPERFTAVMNEAASKEGDEWRSLQMAFARWAARENSATAGDYISKIESNCSGIDELLFLKANLAYSNDLNDQARSLIDEAMAIDPANARWPLAAARILYSADRQDEALALCEETVRQRPENITAALYLLSLYERMGLNDRLEEESGRLKEQLNVETLPPSPEEGGL